MVTVSVAGFTMTVTVVVPVKPEAALVAFTVKTNACGPASCGTTGAVKVWIEPSAAPGTSTMPAGAIHVYVTGPPAGSMDEAVSVTGAPLATGFAGAEVAVTAGAVPGGAVATGTRTFAVAGSVVLLPPTVSWNVSVVGEATTGATNVAVALFAFVIVTSGSPGLTTCCHTNGPLTGLLPVELSVTTVPVGTGPGAGEKLPTAVATAVTPPVTIYAVCLHVAGKGDIGFADRLEH